MPSLEERVAYLEGRFGDHAATIDELRTGQTETRTDLRSGLTDVRRELHEFRADTNRRFDEVRGEIVTSGTTRIVASRKCEAKWARCARRRTVVLRRSTARFDRHFTWLVGIQVAVLVSVVGALVRSYYR